MKKLTSKELNDTFQILMRLEGELDTKWLHSNKKDKAKYRAWIQITIDAAALVLDLAESIDFPKTKKKSK